MMQPMRLGVVLFVPAIFLDLFIGYFLVHVTSNNFQVHLFINISIVLNLVFFAILSYLPDW